MTGEAAIALAIAGLFGVGDWVSRLRHTDWLEYLCKPATLTALLVVTSTLHPGPGLGLRREWFVAALGFSLVGDVLLMLPTDAFVTGLAAFLLAHLCYVVGFFSKGPVGWALLVSAIGVVLLITPIAVRLLRSLEDKSTLRGPVALYMGVISVMLATALATGNAFAAVGAMLFTLSDSMIGWDRFVRPFRAAPVAIMVTYHLGQAGLVLSLLR